MSIPTLAVDTTAEYMLNVSWQCVNTSSASINPRFRVVAPTKHDLSSLFHSLGLTFCRGLLNVVQATHPPSIMWFETLPDDVPRGYWGIYILVLQKDGYRPGLYIGSGTQAIGGVARRIKSYYYSSPTMPFYVKKYSQNGYSIVYHRLLAWCPIPSPEHIPRFRTAIIILEAAFTSTFWALHHRDKSYCGLDSTCPWPRDLFEWDGLASHSPLLEGFWPNQHGLGLSSEELDKIAVEIKDRGYRLVKEYYQKNRDRILRYCKKYAQENKNKRRRYKSEYYRKNRDRICQSTREYGQKNRDRIRQRTREYRQKNRDRIRRVKREYGQKNRDRIRRAKREYYQKNRDSFLRHARERRQYRPYVCEPCGMSFARPSEQAVHEKSLKHIMNTPHLGDVESRIRARDETAFKCEPCGKSFASPHKLARHEKSLKHIRNTPHLGDMESRRQEPGFKCEPCQESFTCSSSLKRHEKSLKHIRNTPHLGDIDSRLQGLGFKCEPCQESFTCSSSLKTHEKSLKHIKRLRSLAEIEDIPYK